ncbi:Maf family nucleotide pyrophosphatase [Aurantivibrio plasticivorans]
MQVNFGDQKPSLVLASSSVYRRELLSRLGLPFLHLSPDIDESPFPREAPEALVDRLARSKAERVISTIRSGFTVDRADLAETAWVIASDQVASLNGELLGKPNSVPRAIEQLSRCSGHQVCFHTSLCLYSLGAGVDAKLIDAFISSTKVSFRELTRAQIENYIHREKPLDCAGSFKVEGLGVSLFTGIESDDPTSLIGLPLIALTGMLQSVGLDPLSVNSIQ